jgi:hypothetical protein
MRIIALFTFSALMSLLVPPTAHADLVSDLAACTEISTRDERLACFDKAVTASPAVDVARRKPDISKSANAKVALIKFECVKTDKSGIVWLVEANPTTKEVRFFTKLPGGHTNASGPHPADISPEKIIWTYRFSVGKTWSQTRWTIDRRQGIGTIEIISSDDDPWSERNIPCKYQ